MDKVKAFLRSIYDAYIRFSNGDYIIPKRFVHLFVVVLIIGFVMLEVLLPPTSMTQHDLLEITNKVTNDVKLGSITTFKTDMPEKVVSTINERVSNITNVNPKEIYFQSPAKYDGWTMYEKGVYRYNIEFGDNSIYKMFSVNSNIKIKSNDVLVVLFSHPDLDVSGNIIYEDMGNVNWVSNDSDGLSIAIEYKRSGYRTIILDNVESLSVDDKVKLTLISG